MKKSKKIFLLISSAIILFGMLYGTTYIPKKIITMDASEVSKIDVFDGNRGEQITVIDSEQIKHIISNLNKITFNKGKPSIGYTGYKFRMTIYDGNGKEQKELIINSNNKIRYKGFFYTGKKSSIDFDYIDKIFKKS
ncbi:hypothetical protein GCM10011351_08530 [Paraliobacillus quinghaiensis]|uniref:Uncharacterized protein n=1 Tax=Paraliobacillus quinghaiensis TaxID=470815 RepID=A0A917WSG7_9BACI|nr:hypothetical protein [Paraliobacillus quinghaiensis]GGM25157.1 hypothetical protein GCM10011351_08530 [Paraliobacillus quinghaiensis]